MVLPPANLTYGVLSNVLVNVPDTRKAVGL